MSLLGSITGGSNLFGIAGQMALAAATGGSSLAITTALRGVMLSVGDQVLAQLGQSLGLPPAVTDLAQAAFHAEAGDVGGAFQSIENASSELGSAAGLDSQSTGQIQNQAYDAVQNLVSQIRDGMTDGKDADGNSAKAAAAGGGKGQSFLVALAIAMGKATDSKMDDMLKLAKNIDQANGSGDKSHITEMSGQMQAMSQEVSMLSTALSTSIKAIGEAASTLARKQ